MNIKINKTFVIVLFLLAGFIAGTLSAQEGVKTVPADDFFWALEEVRGDAGGVILDIRTPGEFERGHAPGALNIDYYDSGFASALDKLDRDEQYFIYCNSGNRSGRSLALFQQLGFKNVYDLAGGWSHNSELLSQIKDN